VSTGDLLTVAGFRTGWALARWLPERAAYALVDTLAATAYARGGDDIDRLRANYAAARPDLDPAALDALVAEGVRANLRYYYETFRLPAMSGADIDARVRVEGDAPVRAELAAGRPVICFLGHLGNWDLAGAWCCRTLGRVVTVAEVVKPERIYREFLDVRTSMGMRVIPLTEGVDTFAQVRRETTGPVVVPLLADRDMTGAGIDVDFVGRRTRMAIGPAALALTTGSLLVPVSIRHEPRGAGWGIVITFHDPVAAPPPGPTRRRILAMTQACADVIADEVRAHTADWHMFQRIFTDDRGESP
jgi:lauroyl/myristoyl acyltransferase